MLEAEIGGVRFLLDPAALSAVRYRAAYGGSIVTHLADARTPKEREGRLLRMCHIMIPPANRPALPDFARLARRDRGFYKTALRARDALLAPDPLHPTAGNAETAEAFDEYKVLALVAVSGVDMSLICEVPILQLLSIVRMAYDLRDPDRKTYRPMTGDEMATIYGRRQKHGEAGSERL